MPFADLSPTASISIEYEFAPVAAALAEAKLVTVMFDIPPVPPVSEAEPAVTAPEPLTVTVIPAVDISTVLSIP